MILYEESKALEHAIGEDAAKIITKVFERQGALVTMELPTKKDLADGLKANRSDFQTALRESELRTQLEIEKVRAELKTDIEKVRAETEKVRGEVKETEARLKVEIEKVRAELTEKMEANKHEILKWMMGTVVAQTALIVAVIGVGIALMSK